MMMDSQEFVKRCKKCQENANFHKTPVAELSLLMASRPFSQWGIYLLGPFPIGPGQVKYLIVVVDYYTKWVETEPLASISSANYQSVISDNGMQFVDKKFREFLIGLGIKQMFSSVEHPQTNGQVEAANKVILQGLKKGLDQKKGVWVDELTEGKLVTNWEGPYRVKEVVGNGAYKLERLDGKEVPRTWNVANLTSLARLPLHGTDHPGSQRHREHYIKRLQK
ncbi:uncharacterized protein K02A2.6-like [Arachis ipaensis]|uniref:uncharacterized protein K02A2.6-like n=1 Tax=Arachis ipaensis TaxID=130454 RepID=UPI0007AFE21C|nr:uncharacterized protein K02A2.6-like [Arachis ipaensis]XP_025665172.1 uncharacterized protein K02A2.6-like [Arachis hypogaea]